MSRAINILLGEILEAIELVQRYTEGLSYEDLEANVEKQDSVLRGDVIGSSLDWFVGSWTEEQAREFDEAVAVFETTE